MKHGGKRKGAGRKPRLAPRKVLTIRLEPDDVETFKRLCKAQGLSQSKLLTTWIRESVQQRYVRLVCSDWRCWWSGPESKALRAPDPFNEGDTIIACPKCREQTLHTCYYEPNYQCPPAQP